METVSLQEALERLQSELTATSNTGLDALKDWLQDGRNIARADGELDLYPTIIRVLLFYMRRQLASLTKGKKTSFRTDGASVLVQAVRAACRSGRRGGPPRLLRVQRKIWEHLEEVLRCEPVALRQPTLLPYYCRLARELAEAGGQGLLAELRGEPLKRLLGLLLGLRGAEAQSAGLDAAAQLLRQAEGDVSAEVPWIAERLLPHLRGAGQPAAGCLAALALRCPLALRDWLLQEGHADALVHAAMGAWSLKTADALDLVLRLVLGLDVPASAKSVNALIPVVAEALESLVRSQAADSSGTGSSSGSSSSSSFVPGMGDLSKPPRVARLAELLALSLLRAETSPAAVVKRLSTHLEHRCLPWALAAVRLCEGHTSAFANEGPSDAWPVLLAVLDALLAQLSRAKLSPLELSAVHHAISAAVTTYLWLQIWPSGKHIPGVTAPQSCLSGDGLGVSLAAPHLLGATPLRSSGPLRGEWRERFQRLVDHTSGLFTAGAVSRGLHHMVLSMFLAAPAGFQPVDNLARHLLTLQSVIRPTGLSAFDLVSRTCVVAAMQRFRPDSKVQEELFQSLGSEDPDLQLAFLRLCSTAGESSVSSQASSSISPAPPRPITDEEDLLCAFTAPAAGMRDNEQEEDENSMSRLLCCWREGAGVRLSRLVEGLMAAIALDRTSGTTSDGGSAACFGSGSIVPAHDDLRVHSVAEMVSFRTPPSLLELVKCVRPLAPSRKGDPASVEHCRIPDLPAGAAVCRAALNHFLALSEPLLDSEGADVLKLAASAATLVPALALALHLPRDPDCGWLKTVHRCILRVLELASELIDGAASARVAAPLFAALLDLCYRADALLTGDIQQQGQQGSQSSAGQERDGGFFASPEALASCLRLAETLGRAWAWTGAAGPGGSGAGAGSGLGLGGRADLFDSRGPAGTAAAPRLEGPPVARALVLRLLLVLGRLTKGVDVGNETQPAVIESLRQLLLRTARSEPAAIPLALRVIAAEIAASRNRWPLAMLDVAAEAWCTITESLPANELENALLCAMRLSAVAAGDGEALSRVFRRLWTGTGEQQLAAFTRRWRMEPSWPGPGAKVVFASLLAQSLKVLRGLSGADAAADLVVDCCASLVPDLILNDENCEVRLGTSVTCTRLLFEIFDDTQVYPEFAAALEGLSSSAGDTPNALPSSASLSTLQVMLEVSATNEYMQRILPQLAIVPAGLRPAVRAALRAFDERFMGSGSVGAGEASQVAMLLRTQIFTAHLKSRRRLGELPLSCLALGLPARPPREGIGRHLGAAIAALALTEELGQLAGLAEACGHRAGAPEFDTLIFVPLAGALLPLRRSLEPLTERYGAAFVATQCKKQAHRIVAFSLQLPFITQHTPHALDGQKLSLAFQELDKQSPWVDFQAFVSRHFRFLLPQLDKILLAWARWAPAATLDLLRSFVAWSGPLSGSRLRLLLPTLQRHGLVLPLAQRRELRSVIEGVVASSTPGALTLLAVHQDDSLRGLLLTIEREWSASSLAPHNRSSEASCCPALSALLVILQSLRSGRGVGPELSNGEGGIEWLRLQVGAMLPRLQPAAQQVLQEATEALAERANSSKVEGEAGGAGGPPKRQKLRRGRSATAAAAAPSGAAAPAPDSSTSALQHIGPPPVGLAWGPPPAPDLGALARCLDTSIGAGQPGEQQDEDPTLTHALRLLMQPQLVEHMKRDSTLARAVTRGISTMDPMQTACLQTEPKAGAWDRLLQEVLAPGTGTGRKPAGLDEVLCSAALLGASRLQVHPSASVRQLAASGLQQLSRQRPAFQGALGVLGRLLDAKHLCLEDLKDVQATENLEKAPSSTEQMQGQRTAAPGESEPPWEMFAGATEHNRDFSGWVRGLASRMLALGEEFWGSSTVGVMSCCVPLTQEVDWFAEQMLLLAILKAADLQKGGAQLAEALTGFFRGSPAATHAQCVIRALHLVRLYQTATKQRAVPHFPADATDAFWSAIDLCAVANCSSRVGWARDGLLYLELHLARTHPDMPIDQTLLKQGVSTTVDDLFQAPTSEVHLLHGLAQQMPDDELLYGVSEWCHATSRLVRAELGQDHLATLHLHSDLREAAMHTAPKADDAATRAGLDDALARLGLHTALAGAPMPESGASAATWDRRMEGLWRLRQWGPVQGAEGFHASLHASLSGFAGSGQGEGSFAGTTAAVRPLVSLAAKVTGTLQTCAPKQLRQGVVRLQMLGSVFSLVDAKTRDLAETTGSGTCTSVAVNALACQWASSLKRPSSAQQFQLLEPLHALRSTLLALAAPPLAQLRFLTSVASKAREASQAHRALGLLEQAQRLASGSSRSDMWKLHWEQAQCLWDLRQQSEALCIARAVATECRSVDLLQKGGSQDFSGAERAWAAGMLCKAGLWLSVSRLEGPDVIRRDYLEPAVALDPGGPVPRRQFADFLDSRLTEELARQSSLESAHRRDLHRRTEAELQEVQKEIQALERDRSGKSRELEMRALREQQYKLQKFSADDQKSFACEQERLKSLALSCMQQMGKCLTEGIGGNLTKIACRFLSLWFDYSREYPEVTTSVREAIPRMGLAPLTPFIYQLASRLDMQEGPFQQTLDELLVRIVTRCPQALWPLILIRNGNQVPKAMRHSERFQADIGKINAAQRVLERLRKIPAVKPVLEAVDVLSRFYLAVAFSPVDKRNREAEVQLNTIQPFKEVRRVLQSTQVPVPTAPLSADGSTAPTINSFADSFGIAKQGVSAPKILKVRDTEGQEHQQIVKGMDDLRQDAVMQQLFRLLNDVFAENALSRQANLRLRTFQVVPLSPCAGVVECVTETLTLGEMLTGNAAPAEGAHHKYRPQDWTHHVCRKHMQEAREAFSAGNQGVLDATLIEVYKNFKPVMHVAFLERYPSPTEWHLARQQYAKSAAVSSIVGYIVGIGDRHPNNILFDYQTGELVHIDFGITFEAGKALRVPELVPFRLTRDMVDGLGCLGTCGLFRQCCETTMEVLRESAALVVAVAEVFVHDPVYHWSMSPRKVRQNDPAVSDHAAGDKEAPNVAWAIAGAGGVASAMDGNEMARRALMAVKGKLHGTHEMAAALGVPAHVGWVIHEAVDVANLAQMYFGWSPWL